MMYHDDSVTFIPKPTNSVLLSSSKQTWQFKRLATRYILLLIFLNVVCKQRPNRRAYKSVCISRKKNGGLYGLWCCGRSLVIHRSHWLLSFDSGRRARCMSSGGLVLSRLEQRGNAIKKAIIASSACQIRTCVSCLSPPCPKRTPYRTNWSGYRLQIGPVLAFRFESIPVVALETDEVKRLASAIFITNFTTLHLFKC